MHKSMHGGFMVFDAFVTRDSLRPVRRLSDVQRPYNLHVLSDTMGRDVFVVKDPDGTEHLTHSAADIRTETDAQGRTRAVFVGGG